MPSVYLSLLWVTDDENLFAISSRRDRLEECGVTGMPRHPEERDIQRCRSTDDVRSGPDSGRRGDHNVRRRTAFTHWCMGSDMVRGGEEIAVLIGFEQHSRPKELGCDLLMVPQSHCGRDDDHERLQSGRDLGA